MIIYSSPYSIKKKKKWCDRILLEARNSGFYTKFLLNLILNYNPYFDGMLHIGPVINIEVFHAFGIDAESKYSR